MNYGLIALCASFLDEKPYLRVIQGQRYMVRGAGAAKVRELEREYRGYIQSGIITQAEVDELIDLQVMLVLVLAN